MATVLMVGTKKGLWIGRSDDARTEWEWSEPQFGLHEVYSCLIDTRGDRPRLLADAALSWTGPNVQRSDDLGETWQETPGGAVKFPEDTGASVSRVWQLVAGPEEGVVYAGTEPGAVFRSIDGGETFELVRALWDHPHRTEWGAGFGGQAFHTVLPHPTDPKSITAAISSGGVYQTRDGGESWEARSKGIRADFLPEDQRYPEFGQCVHKIDRHPDHPERLFVQNHGGVYRSDDEGATYVDIGDGLPSDFGFPMVVHPHEPETIFVYPLLGMEGRWAPEGKATVWRSRDAGGSWEPLSKGLPEEFYVGVMRDAMCADTHHPAGLYFGARNGAVFASPDAGESWTEIKHNLPDVMCVRAAAI